MRRKTTIFGLFVLTIALSACEKSVSETKSQNAKPLPGNSSAAKTPNTVPSIPKNGNYDARGTVTKINLEAGSVEIDHEEIKDLMPKMQMEFFVSDQSLLKDLQVGDKVEFVIEYKHPTEIITSLKKAK